MTDAQKADSAPVTVERWQPHVIAKCGECGAQAHDGGPISRMTRRDVTFWARAHARLHGHRVEVERSEVTVYDRSQNGRSEPQVDTGTPKKAR